MRCRVVAAVALLTCLVVAGDPVRAGAGSGDSRDSGQELPLPIPERPFLLLDAPRRFVAGQPAWARVQLRGGGRVEVALFRVRDPLRLLRRGPGLWRQGVAIARSPLGTEAEQLVAASAVGDARRASRSGSRLRLVGKHDVLVRDVGRPRRVSDETGAYDANQAEDQVATYWVRQEEWGQARVSLGRLQPGLYLVRAHRGAWAAAALLSVGRVTLLVRRGDQHDVLLVTDADGRPRAGVQIEARAANGAVRRARTGRDGTLRLPAVDTPSLRFVARDGDDVAWSDVTHARLSRCDPRVYLATGRPVYRAGETIYLRGHVRGCGEDGSFVPLASEVLRLWPTRTAADGKDRGSIARTDADGNFTAELVATSDGSIRARLRGRDHLRDVQLDNRLLPQRALLVRLDRSWAAAGQTVAVSVSDDEGGWPRERAVTLRTPAGRLQGRIGPGRPARFSFRVPPVVALEAVSVSATITGDHRVTTATAQLWVGSQPEVVHLHADRTRGRRGESLPVRVTAANLGGDPVTGPVLLSVSGSDGNRPTGAARWRAELTLRPGGAAGLVELAGDGPWWVEARRGQATASLVVWSQPRPPSLSARGPLAVLPATLLVQPELPLDVQVRLPPGGGRAWVTLEQGDVWSSAMVHGSGTVQARLAVPAAARGLATVVVSHVARGRVRTATATVEVQTSRQVELAVQTDRRVYAEGARARVSIRARSSDGKPRDGVVSLWLADAGYWELGQERYPAAGDFFALPGRTSSAGDSSQPIAFGAEEGRRPDATLLYNGQPLARASLRHGWGHGGDLVALDVRGDLSAIATRLARAAGLAGAWVCASAVRDAGQVWLRARGLPWDLVARRVAEQTATTARLRRRVLRFECGVSSGGVGGHGGLGGSGVGRGGGGLSGRGGSMREQHLAGTLHFVGLRRLRSDGTLELELDLPRQPGRWRVEVLSIAADGGGARAHAVVHTVRPLLATIDLVAALQAGDETRGAIELHGARLGGQEVALKLELPATLRLLAALPARVRLDARGRATVSLRLRAERSGAGQVAARASCGSARDAVVRRLDVGQPAAQRAVDLRAVVGPAATDVRLDVPELSRPSQLEVAIEVDPRRAVREVLDRLRQPRWDLAVMAIDRLGSLRALDGALEALGRARGSQLDRDAIANLRAELSRDITGELTALESLQAPDGGVAWWTTLRADSRLTALALAHARQRAHHRRWQSALDALRLRARQRRLPAAAIGPAAAALAASGKAGDQQLALNLLRTVGPGVDLEGASWALRSAHRLKASDLQARFAGLAVGGIRAALARAPAPSCGGPSWFLCFARHGQQGTVARAAVALLEVGHPDARALSARVASWLAQQPTSPSWWWVWGTDEADALALLLRLQASNAARTRGDGTRFTVLHHGRAVAHGRAGAPVALRVHRAGPLVVRLAAADGRAARVRIAGTLAVRPPQQPVGPARLTRRFVRDAAASSAWHVDVAFHLDRDARQVVVNLPLPAGLELAGDPGRRHALSSSSALHWRSWVDAGDPRRTARPRLWDGGDGLHLGWPRLAAGEHQVRIHLVEVARGDYRVAPAWLRTGDASSWAITRADRVRLSP